MGALPTTDPAQALGQRQQERIIQIDNRILAKPNGKPITVMDLAKRLDFHFHRNFPQYSRSVEARYQFYSEGWRQVLDEMINNELILADAEEKKVTVSDGEVRREMEETLGPNVVENLDELNMTFEEAMQMVRADMISERMKGYMVTSRAMVLLSPEKIRLAYDTFEKEQGDTDEWQYQVLSVRHRTQPEAEDIAGRAALMIADGKTLEETKEALSKLREAGEIEESAVITLSELETRSDKTLAASHREILAELSDDSYSPPQAQVSRVDGSTVMRLFYLKEHAVKTPPNFEEMQGPLKNKLLQATAGQEQERYIKRLRTQYGATEDSIGQHTPPGFQPFSLQGSPFI